MITHSSLLRVTEPPSAVRVLRFTTSAPAPASLPAVPLGVELTGWVDEDGTQWAGVGRGSRWRAGTGVAMLDRVQQLLRDSGPDADEVRAFFCLAFDPEHPTDPLGAAVPATEVVLPRWLLRWTPRNLRGDGLVTAWVLGVEGESVEALHRSADDLRAWLAQPAERKELAGPIVRVAASEVQTNFEDAVSQALALIRSGVLEKVVLARPCYLESAAHISSWAVFQALFKRAPGTMRFHFRAADGATFLGASPECLVALSGKRVRVDVVAGTIARGATPALDAQQADLLRHSAKDRHEHALVRSAVLDALSPLVDDAEAAAQPGLLPLKHVWHLQTPVAGTLRAGVSWEEIVRALHPTPAVGGTPRRVALSTIAELETMGRGYYAAPVGWISATGGMAAVGIRSAHVRGNRAVAMAGAGIVAGSSPRAEWEETERKLNPMLEAFLGASQTLEPAR